MKWMKYMVSFCFLLGLIIEGILFLLRTSPPSIVKSMVVGDDPKEFLAPRQYFSELSDYAVCCDRIYILFGDIGVLEIYTLDGNYIKSFAFGIQKTGKSQLYVNSSGVWLEDQSHSLFRFVNENYINKCPEEDYWTLHHSFYSEKQSRTSVDGSQFYMKWTKIYNSDVVVITRPWYCILVQGFVPLIVHVIFLFSFAFIFFVYRKTIK